MVQNLDITKPPNGGLLISSEIRNNFASLASNNEGSTEPTPSYEGMFWLDTSNPTMPVLKQKLNGAFRTLLIYDLTGDEVEVVSGAIMAKQDFKHGQSPVETPDGIISTFTLPGGESYIPGTIAVFINGQQYNPANIQQNGPSYDTFTIIGGDNIPDDSLDDVFVFSYVKA